MAGPFLMAFDASTGHRAAPQHPLPGDGGPLSPPPKPLDSRCCCTLRPPPSPGEAFPPASGRVSEAGGRRLRKGDAVLFSSWRPAGGRGGGGPRDDGGGGSGDVCRRSLRCGAVAEWQTGGRRRRHRQRRPSAGPGDHQVVGTMGRHTNSREAAPKEVGEGCRMSFSRKDTDIPVFRFPPPLSPPSSPPSPPSLLPPPPPCPSCPCFLPSDVSGSHRPCADLTRYLMLTNSDRGAEEADQQPLSATRSPEEAIGRRYGEAEAHEKDEDETEEEDPAAAAASSAKAHAVKVARFSGVASFWESRAAAMASAASRAAGRGGGAPSEREVAPLHRTTSMASAWSR